MNDTDKLQRRSFLARLVAALPAMRLALAEDRLPPVRAITRGPQFHWFGYYDKLQFDPTGRFVLGNEIGFEHRSPRPDDVLKIGMIDLHDRDRWIELGETRAWNWQQGCMLQWLPGSKKEIIWNDRVGDRFVSHILDIHTRKQRTLPAPIYTLSPDGRTAIAPDFRRLNDCRPGYGYAGIPDPNRAQRAPADAGIWQMDLRTGKQKLLYTFAQAAGLPFQEKSRPVHNDPATAKHWFNHLLYAPDGKRLLFLHRWRVFAGPDQQATFSTRMFTINPDGSAPYIVDPYGGTSHFIWRDARHICAWAFHPSHGQKFYLYEDRTEKVAVVAPEVMTVNGHNTYLPRRNNEWILNDTYPDKERLQHPYLYHLPTNRRIPLGHFHAPPAYANEWRCDLHPRYSPDGTKVVIDSTHEGKGRQMYLIDIAEIVATLSRHASSRRL